MALKTTTREVDGVTVVALDGRIVLGEESNALREKVKSLVAEGKKKVVLNMANISFIDSAGLGTKRNGHDSIQLHLRASGEETLPLVAQLGRTESATADDRCSEDAQAAVREHHHLSPASHHEREQRIHQR